MELKNKLRLQKDKQKLLWKNNNLPCVDETLTVACNETTDKCYASFKLVSKEQNISLS